MSDYAWTVDVLVMGGGACGAAAALAASDAGAQVLVLEREAHASGTTSMSMGLVCAAGTRAQAQRDVADDADTFFADIIAKTGGQTDPVIARAIADNSGPTLDWLAQTHDFPWELDTRFRAAYGNSRLRVHGWPGHAGADMIALLHRKLSDAGVTVVYQAPVTAFDADHTGHIHGLEIMRPGGEVERIGCRALVVASGGFAANPAMLAHYIPDMVRARNNGHDSNQGDGIRLTHALGGALSDMAAFQGYAMLTDPHGISVPPGFPIEGAILVNAKGARFVDETDDIAGMVYPVMAQPGQTAWVVFDATIEQRNAYQPDAQVLATLNAARRGTSPEALADAIGASRTVLAAALADAHAASRAGTPDAVGRHWHTDAAPPSGALGALRVVGAIYHTQGGLQIDGHAQVLRADGSVLPNVFAGGGAARSVSGPGASGYLPAMGLCTALTLGRLAGEGAARMAAKP